MNGGNESVPPMVDACILELGGVIAGNVAGAMLADLGAEVIKVEPFSGDPARNPGIAGYNGESAIHLTVNRNKKSISIDLKDPKGRQIFLDLARSADVVMDNLRPGARERLGIDYDALVEVNPRIVSCSVTGFGQSGPASQRPAFDLVVQALSGHMSMTGSPDSPPARVGVPLADLMGGVFGCLSVLVALLNREKSGAGRRIDVAMLDSLVHLLNYHATLYLNTGEQEPRTGNVHPHLVPWQTFTTKSGYIAITARGDVFWGRLCEALGRPDLKDDPRSRTNPDRVANREWVIGEIQGILETRTTDEWLSILEAHDVPVAPVNDFAGTFDDPQIQARGLVRSYTHPEAGEVRYVGSPAQFEGWEYPSRPAPALGEHTESILRERLGLDDRTIRELREADVIRPPSRP